MSKLFCWNSPLRPVVIGSMLVLGLASSAMADLVPFDPHALFATGGDAVDISDAGLPIIFSTTGGGIFVFHNATGADLQALEVDVQFPDPTFPSGFGVTGTIFVPAGSGQQASFRSFSFPATDCDGTTPTGHSCVQMLFSLDPGPLVAAGGNFVLDFDAPSCTGTGIHQLCTYTGVDALVAQGLYTGETDTSSARVGEWPTGAQGFVTPFTAVPEPRQYAGLLAGVLALAIFFRSRRSAVAR